MAAAPNMGDEPQNAEEVVDMFADMEKCFDLIYKDEDLKDFDDDDDEGEMDNLLSLIDVAHNDPERACELTEFMEKQRERWEESPMSQYQFIANCCIGHDGRMNIKPIDASAELLSEVFSKPIEGQIFPYSDFVGEMFFSPFPKNENTAETVQGYVYGCEAKKTKNAYVFTYAIPRTGNTSFVQPHEFFISDMEMMIRQFPNILESLEKARSSKEFKELYYAGWERQNRIFEAEHEGQEEMMD